MAFARHLDTASEGMIRFLLGRKAHAIIEQAFAKPEHELSYENVVLAESRQEIVGMASGFLGSERGQGSEPVRRAAGWHVPRLYAASLLLMGLLRFIDRVPPNDFYLQAVAVDDAQRGSGIGSRLLDAMEDRARARGAERFVLDVAVKNTGARRLYERRGMREVARSPRVLFMRDTNVVRMAKEL